ncbi:NAD(+)/NADH kinase [Microbacterium sp. VKM Ac-2870]|uniref:NAD(+)/NADH kinase n=1 Tax=Microbacterium sp. VKM Ac-2870 TaxID=2783825 RepID=UPI00188C8731|nr:NAD(+)/NADH kinase [Microbacterium sp. VKM Ac-2870]MBF4562316.1 NAD(+)/NADH kinase [Microbacterium sp. VKM Ac-2870]
MATPRAVIVYRASELTELLARHGTRGQVAFFLDQRGQSLAAVEERHERIRAALADVSAGLPVDWRRASVERGELARFVFEPADIVLVVGQDGLVANAAKYLSAQPVIGIDPLPGVNPGVLVPHTPAAGVALAGAASEGTAAICERTMVHVRTDDGQSLTALNEVMIGQPGHQSARYTLEVDGHNERQSSSGVIVSTGTGATGWCRSIARIQAPQLGLPAPTDRTLAWFVREPWPSPATGADLFAGRLDNGELTLRVESDRLVAFGDGMEDDRLLLSWGQRVSVSVADRTLRTVTG